MKFLHYDSLTSQLSNETIKIKTEENNLGKYYSKANFLKINVFTLTKHFHKLSRKITIKLHSDSNINMLPHFLSHSLSAFGTYACVCVYPYIRM